MQRNDSIESTTPNHEKPSQGPADDFANKIMAKLQASKPVAFQFALYVRLQLKPFESKKGWFPEFNSSARYEEKTDGNGNRSSIFYFDQDQTLFQNVELLISYLLKDSAFWEWKKQQPSPPPSIGPAPGTPEADEAKREARIRFMQKAGATEKEIASYERGLLGSDLFGPGGDFWSTMEALSPVAKGIKIPTRRLASPARRGRKPVVSEQSQPKDRGNDSTASLRSGDYLFDNWYKSTFPNLRQSISYHLAKHGKGRSATEYTRQGMDFFQKNRHLGQDVILNDGTPGIKIQQKIILPGKKTQKVGGYWTKDGKLVTFWD